MKYPKLEIYKGLDGWRWRLKAANGAVIAEGGEAYARKPKASAIQSRVFNALMRAHYKTEE